MKLEGKSEIDFLFCNLSGCHNTFHSVGALMYYLHIGGLSVLPSMSFIAIPKVPFWTEPYLPPTI